MTIVYDQLLQLDLPERELSYSARDAMLYALSVGMGEDPMDTDELRFVVENLEGDGRLRTLPSLATVIAWDDRFSRAAGIDLVRSVHGEQRLTIHRPLPPEGRIRSKTRFIDAFDKGEGKGALVLVENAIVDVADNAPLVTLLTTTFARGDGGFAARGGSRNYSRESKPPVPYQLPIRPSDVVVSAKTQPNQALFYRLCGDRNPLHADPNFAGAAGFPQPILHGLCTYGYAVRALVTSVCGYDPNRLEHIEARFTAPVFPGETIVTEIWTSDGQGVVGFRARVAERGLVVLDHGMARVRPIGQSVTPKFARRP